MRSENNGKLLALLKVLLFQSKFLPISSAELMALETNWAGAGRSMEEAVVVVMALHSSSVWMTVPFPLHPHLPESAKK